MSAFIETRINNEYHANGLLAYTETVAVLGPLFAHLFDNIRIASNGSQWIRIGLCAKYFDNGQLAWQLSYDENGNAKKDNSPQYRKDGTIITT